MGSGEASRDRGIDEEAWDDPRLTEARNPRTEEIDRASPREIVEMIQAEDRTVPEAVEAEAESITELVRRVVEKFRRGGRLFYVGAGTSGRLGVLDAAECPPTFGTDPEMVQGIIAGGRETLVRSREGVEDDRPAGRRAVEGSRIGEGDFVLGIATSGTTPFVQAAMEEAAERGAGTGFLSCTPPPERMEEVADVLVTPLVGPEVIAGSTRMKAGTATKLVLNTLTTAAMVRLGKTYGNLMVDLQAVSEKLVDRSLRIVRAVCGVDEERARRLIRAAGGSVKTALAMDRLDVGRAEAERVLDACGGFLGEALDRYEGAEGVPYYACYPESPEDRGAVDRLVERLEADPERIAAAVDELPPPGSRPPGAASGGWGPREHVAHLHEFEYGGVRPRVEGTGAGETSFADMPPSDPPPGADESLQVLLDRFREERRRTLETLEEAMEEAGTMELLGRRFTVGEEQMTLHQFLRGVAHHAEAHADRIGERVHPSLLTAEEAARRRDVSETGEPSGGAPPVGGPGPGEPPG